MKNLKIVIVGAGMGGLEAALALAADGHEVTVLEGAEKFEEVGAFNSSQRQMTILISNDQVGAGIRVPPNSSRLMLRWGVDFSDLKKEVSRGNRFLDWKDGRKLLDVPFSNVEQLYGSPYYFIHRADLVKKLVMTAQQKKGITVKTGKKVVEYDYDSPRVRTANGEWYSGDLVIAADGMPLLLHPC